MLKIFPPKQSNITETIQYYCFKVVFKNFRQCLNLQLLMGVMWLQRNSKQNLITVSQCHGCLTSEYNSSISFTFLQKKPLSRNTASIDYTLLLQRLLCTVVSGKMVCQCWTLHRGSYISAQVWLNLLNKLGKRDKMRGLPSILSLFPNSFNKFNQTWARMLESIYHMTLRLLWNLISAVKTL